MTKRERKYLHAKKWFRGFTSNGVHCQSFKLPKQKVVEEMPPGYLLAIPNFGYDQEGNIIPPVNGEKPTTTITWYPHKTT